MKSAPDVRPWSSAAVLLSLSLLVSAIAGAAAVDPYAQRLPASSSTRAAKSPMLDVARCGNRLVAVGIRGHILVSQDDGLSWEQRPSPIDVTLTSLVCTGNHVGFAVGHEETMLRTDDDGLTWQVVHTAASGTPLLRVRFFGVSNGFAVGGLGVIFSTRDAGATWTRHIVNTEDGFDPHLFDIATLADGRLILAGEAGRLFRSSDVGASWHELPSPYNGSFFGLVTLGTDGVMAFGMLGHVFFSADAGDSWNALSTGETQSFFSSAVTEDSIYLVGADGAVATTARDRPQQFSLTIVPERPNITGLATTPGGLVVASDRGLKRVSLPARHLARH
jgi:photosystem II stability/assembly factor-like uncharacterized protein